MAVNLSPVFGVAAQLFNDNGDPLAGGKIYTYLAGTNTPAPTYTTSAGSTAHSNPIVLDGAGRVPTGEIWLTDGITYKFVVEDSASALIGTYDNLTGINSNFVAFTNSQEIQTATAGQTVFNLTTMQYQPGTNSLTVFVDGVNQYGPGAQYAYAETDSDTVTFVSGLHVGASVKFTTSQLNTSGAVDASQVSYDPPFVNSVVTNVEAKLAQTVSVEDFGAVGDGIVDDTDAIQNAINALATDGGILYFGPKTYLVEQTGGNFALEIKSKIKFQGVSGATTILLGNAATDCGIFGSNSAINNIYFDGITFDGNNGSVAANTFGFKVPNIATFVVTNCTFQGLNKDGILAGETTLAQNVVVDNCIFNADGSTGNGVRVYHNEGLTINSCRFFQYIASPIDTNPTSGSNVQTYAIITNNYLENDSLNWLPGYSSISLLVDRVLCEGNTVIGGGYIVVHDYAGSGQTTRDYRIIGNTILDTVSLGIAVNQGENSDIVISGNNIKGCLSSGIQIVNPNAPPYTTTNPVIISNNIIEDTNTNTVYTNTNQPACILLQQANNVLITGNQCIAPRFAGIWVAGSSDVVIEGNYIVDQKGYAASNFTTFNGGGIVVSPGGGSYTVSVNNVMINGNFVYNFLTTLSGSPSANVRVGGISVFSDATPTYTVSNITITNNLVNQGYGIGIQTYTLESVYINGNYITNTVGTLVDTSSVYRLSNGQIGAYSAAPTTGTWERGSVVYNSAPSAGGTVGWVCVTAGTPGTWKTFGSIAA